MQHPFTTLRTTQNAHLLGTLHKQPKYSKTSMTLHNRQELFGPNLNIPLSMGESVSDFKMTIKEKKLPWLERMKWKSAGEEFTNGH